MKYKTINYLGFELTIEKKVDMNGRQWFCIVRHIVENNKTFIVAKFKLQRDAIWHLDNFDKFPILPL